MARRCESWRGVWQPASVQPFRDIEKYCRGCADVHKAALRDVRGWQEARLSALAVLLAWGFCIGIAYRFALALLVITFAIVWGRWREKWV